MKLLTLTLSNIFQISCKEANSNLRFLQLPEDVKADTVQPTGPTGNTAITTDGSPDEVLD